jgi:hypothetical protein
VVGTLEGVAPAGPVLTVAVGVGVALVGDALPNVLVGGALLGGVLPAAVRLLGAVVAGFVVRGAVVGLAPDGDGVGDDVPWVVPKRLVPWPAEPWTRLLSGRPAASSMNVTMPATTTNMPTAPSTTLRQVGRQLSRQVGRQVRCAVW